MGQTSSRVASKIASSFTFSGTPSEDFNIDGATTAVARFKGTPFVFSRRGLAQYTIIHRLNCDTLQVYVL